MTNINNVYIIEDLNRAEKIELLTETNSNDQ